MADPTPQEIDAVMDLFDRMGIMGLFQAAEAYLTKGYRDPESIMRMISNDPNYQEEYYKRFPGVEMIRKENVDRARAGLPPIPELTAAEYVAEEIAYGEALRNLPGVKPTRENVANWIVNEVSPSEIDERVETARAYINYSVNPRVRAELRDIYGLTDAEMVQYVLSDDNDKEALANEFNKRVRQANVGAAAAQEGIGISRSLALDVANSSDNTATFGQTQRIFKNIAEQATDYNTLGAISGVETSTDDLVADAFGTAGSSAAAKKKKRLASQERARFSKSSGLSRGSLSRGGLGSQ